MRARGVCALLLVVGLVQAELPNFKDTFGREPAGTIGVTISFVSVHKAQIFENVGSAFTPVVNPIANFITSKIPGDLVSAKLNAFGGTKVNEVNGTDASLFLTIELPRALSGLEVFKTIQDNLESEITKATEEISGFAKDNYGIANVTGLAAGTEVPSYSFTFSVTISLKEAVDELNVSEEDLRKVTSAMTQLMSLVGGHVDLLRPSSKAITVSGTNMTINGLFTLEGLSNLPDAAVTAIKEFVDTHASDAIATMLDEFASKFNASEVVDLKLGFNETLDIPKAKTSEDIVVTLEMESEAMATKLEEQTANINLALILFKTVVVPPGTTIMLAENPVSVDGKNVTIKLEIETYGAINSTEADEVIIEFLGDFNATMLPEYTEHMNEYIGKSSDLTFISMSFKMGDFEAGWKPEEEPSPPPAPEAADDDAGADEQTDANDEVSVIEMTITLPSGRTLPDAAIEDWSPEEGSNNTDVTAFVNELESSMVSLFKIACQADGFSGDCDSVTVKLISMTVSSSRRRLLATSVDVKTRVSNMPKGTIDNVITDGGKVAGFSISNVSISLISAALRASTLSMGAFAALVLGLMALL